MQSSLNCSDLFVALCYWQSMQPSTVAATVDPSNRTTSHSSRVVVAPLLLVGVEKACPAHAFDCSYRKYSFVAQTH